MDASVISHSNSKPFSLRGLKQPFYYAHGLYGSGIEWGTARVSCFYCVVSRTLIGNDLMTVNWDFGWSSQPEHKPVVPPYGC